MANNSFEWLKLDNAGKVFPGQNTNQWSNVFRMSIELKSEIDPDILKAALDRTLIRIPYFKVRIRNGLFSNYFEVNEMDCPVNKDIKNPCYRINFKENNGYLFRVYYHNCRISVDVYHALCDGYGASVFLSTLAGEYLRLKGHSISHNSFVLDTNEAPKAEELEDAYARYSSPSAKCNLLETPAYHVKGTRLPLYMGNFTTVTIPFHQLHRISKGYGVTVTEFLAAVMLDIHYQKQLRQGKSKKDVSVQIPVNLRKAFPSESLRNFVICLSVKIEPSKRNYTFEEILQSVSLQLREINNTDYLHAYITQTVNLQTRTLRFVPLAVKNSAIKISFSFGAEYSTSVLISNFGAVKLPEDMSEHVERFFFFTGPGLVNPARCGVISFGDKLVYSFSNCCLESDIEEEFMKRLALMGIPLTVETNRKNSFGEIEGVTVGDPNAFSDRAFIPMKKDKTAGSKNSSISPSEKLKRSILS